MPRDKHIKISELIPDDKNFNKGSQFGNSLIEKSFTKFGAGRSILLDKNNRIIAGNKSVENAAAIGMEDVQIIESDGKRIIAVKRTDIDLDSPEGREMALADNASAKANIIFDAELVEAELGEAVCEEWGVESSVKLEAKEDDFDVPEAGIETDIVLGDLFEIGEHRLLCGDSTDSDQVAKLMNGEKADMVFTDPPYGINVVQGSKVGGDKGFGSVGGEKIVKAKKYSEIIGDDTTDTAKEFYQTCISLGMENFIIWGGNYFTDFLSPSMCWIVWDKQNTGNFADVELAWTSFDKGAKLYKWQWNGMIRQGDKTIEGKTRVHPTQKPVGLFGDIFNDFDFKICFDGFLGSGSTMVASHRLKRKCYGMELDPKYCQVIIDRMQKLDPTIEIKKNGQPYAKAE